MRLWAVGALVVAGLIGSFEKAVAISLSEDGPVARLQGSFAAGDEEVFREFLARPRAQKIRVLYLYSYGGAINSAVKIAEMVRKAGLTTAMRANNDVCDSACTLVFVAGVRRHYVGGADVVEGLSARTGLGFHPARQLVNSVEGSRFSEGGSNQLRALYARMGCPGAGALIREAAINTVYRPSGATALRLKIATSLVAP